MSNWDHVRVTCAACGAAIMLHRQQEEQLRDSHKRFYCPVGHSNYFPGKTSVDKKIDDLRRSLSYAKKDAEGWRELYEQGHKLRHDLVRAIQICPLGCGHVGSRRLSHLPDEETLSRFLDRVYQDLTEHLVVAHNATVKAQRLLAT